MANALNVLNAPRIGGDVLLLISCVLSGSYPAAAAGETIDLTTVTNTAGKDIEGFFENPSAGGVWNASLGGYDAALIPGTLLTNWKLHIWTSGGTELAAGAYPAAISGGNLVLQFLRRLM
jgi:hypothetical protein